MAGPVVLAMLSQTMINLLDTVMVGRLPQAEATAGQTAIGHAIILYWAFGGFLSAIQVGTQAITARRYGESNWEGAGQVLSNSFFLAFSAGAAATIAGFLVTPHLFPYFNANEAVLREGVPYCQARMVGVLSMVATFSMKSFYDGLGRTRVHMTAALVMNGLNVLLNWLLIFGVWIFPRLGVAGAGMASTISSYVGMFILIGWALRARDVERYRYLRKSNFSPRVLWEIVRLSVPSGLATVFVMTGFALFLVIVAMLDEQAAEAIGDPDRRAIFGAATKVNIDILSISFMSCMAFGTATATLVSQSIGKGDTRLAERFGWESVRLGVSFMTILGSLVILFPDVTMGLFTQDQAVIDAGRDSLRMMGISEVCIALGLITAQALFGAGNTKYVMLVELVLHFTCLVPLAWLLGVVLDFGLMGVWISALTYVVLMATLMAWKFYEGKWKDIRL